MFYNVSYFLSLCEIVYVVLLFLIIFELFYNVFVKSEYKYVNY